MKTRKNHEGNCSKVAIIMVVALVYVLAVIAGIAQEFNCCVIEKNYSTSKTADIVTSIPDGVGYVSEDTEFVSVRTPCGTGEYFSMFEKNKELWVVKELTVPESIKLTYMFTILDLVTFCITIWIISHVNYRESLATSLLIMYEIVYLLMSSVLYEYTNKVLYGLNHIGYVLFIIRCLVLSIVAVKAKKS